MNWHGLLIGASSFLIIGLLHPVVVRCEYHFSSKIWPLFAVCGALSCAVSLFFKHPVLSPIAAVFGFALLWSCLELKHQEHRVQKGWFPMNPKRKAPREPRKGDLS